MKKAIFLSLWVLLTLPIVGQEAQKLTQRIYLWDVTLSMKGYEGKTPNIYDDVVSYLENAVNLVKNESTMIYILPFQESVLETWSANATVEGKRYLIEKIKNYQNNKVTSTNIVNPIQYVNKNIILKNKNRDTFFTLLTDGEQSAKFGGMDALVNELRRWEYEQDGRSFLVYVMLTPEANSEAINNLMKNRKNMIAVKPIDRQFEIVDIAAPEHVSINLKDDKKISITFICDSNEGIPDDLIVEYASQDQQGVVKIKGEATIEHGSITIDVNYTNAYQVLKTQLPETYYATLDFSLKNAEEIKGNTHKIAILTNWQTKLEIINKPEKTLKISLKK